MKKRVRFLLVTFVALWLMTICMPFAGAANTASFDTVLVLDVSGSMEDAMEDMKLSAINLCENILSQNSDNQIAIIAFDSVASIKCEMTSDIEALKGVVDSLSDGDLTNMYDAVVMAHDLISRSPQEIKNVIIMADGAPCCGKYDEVGKYTQEYSQTNSLATYCNPIYDYVASQLHPVANVYTVGFFSFDTEDIPDDDDCRLMVEFMDDLANAKSYYPEEAQNMFDNVASDILNPDMHDGSGIGAILAIGICATAGIGGMIALIVALSSKKPTPPPVPPVVIPPVILPIDDDDDRSNNDYVKPSGIGDFAVDAGATMVSYPVVPFVSVYGISGTYRDSVFSIRDGEVISVGRDPASNNLVITNDAAKVSRIHCTFSYHADSDSFIVTDLSKNGTFTRDRKLQYGVPTKVESETRIQLADSSNIFRLG